MLILGLLGMYFDAAVVFVTSQTLLFRLALAILWYLVGKMFKNAGPDSVRSGRTCPANLGVRSCPVRKLICPVRLSPTL